MNVDKVIKCKHWERELKKGAHLSCTTSVKYEIPKLLIKLAEWRKGNENTILLAGEKRKVE